MAYDSPTPKTNEGFLFDGATNFRVQTYRRVDRQIGEVDFFGSMGKERELEA